MKRSISINHVVLVVDAENDGTVDLHINAGFVVTRKPEISDLLILADEIGSLNPKRRRFRMVSSDPDDGKIPRVNPDLPLEALSY
jgi:hypothetical protein